MVHNTLYLYECFHFMFFYLSIQYVGWPGSVICETPDIESVTKVLRSGPYGRCVYDCDNDVMSHQVKDIWQYIEIYVSTERLK